MNLTRRLLILFLGITLSLNIFLLIFNYYAFNESYFLENFKALDVAESIGISESDLEKVTHELVTYIDQGQGNLYVSANVNEERVIYFNQKERIHLDDIYKLADSGRFLLLISQILMIVAFLLLYYFNGGQLEPFLATLLTAVITAGLTLFALGALYFIDFNKAFHKFHQLFFTNDFWLLDPAKDRLIQLMPLQFFIDFTKTWLLTALFVHFILFLLYWFGNKLLKKSTPVEPE